MYESELRCDIPLSVKPVVGLIALGIHGPNLAQRFRSERYWLHLYLYTATLRIAGRDHPIRPGYVSLIPPGAEIEYEWGERAKHLCTHFTLPASEDSDFVSVPLLQDLGGEFSRLYSSLEDAAACFAANPARAAVRVWDVLWQVADRSPRLDAPAVHPWPAPVAMARLIIELRLVEPLCVADIADEVGISHNQLTRLFHAAVGDTVIGYIRTRRVERARHLLEHTTLPIRTIAAQVGMEDSRAFYKLIRDHLGVGPQQVRRNAEQALGAARTDVGLVIR